MMTILQYLKVLKKHKITFDSQSKLLIEGYSDSDWTRDKENRKSILSFIFMFNGGLVSWCSKRKSMIALFSTEVKYITLTLAVKEATCLRLLLTKFGLL